MKDKILIIAFLGLILSGLAFIFIIKPHLMPHGELKKEKFYQSSVGTVEHDDITVAREMTPTEFNSYGGGRYNNSYHSYGGGPYMTLPELDTVIKTGNVIMLRSGGPEMTVESVEKKGAKGALITAVWFDHNKPVRGSFFYGTVVNKTK